MRTQLPFAILVRLLTAILAGQALTASAATLYVWQNSPSPAPPFATWASAATSIQDAIDAATAGDDIVVTNGVYATGGKSRAALTNRVEIGESLTVRSVNGAAETVIEGYQMPGTTNGDSSVRCVYLANGASLMGFTLTNGATRDWIADGIGGNGGAAWCESTNAVIADCVMIGNHAAWVGGGVFRGTLNRCTLASNSSGGGGGGAYGSVLNNCALVGNAAWWNSGGGASFSVLNACVLTDNTAVIFGGGASECVLNNCTVTGNSVSGSSATGNPEHGLFGYGGGVAGCMLNNCIVYHNRAQRGANFGDPAYFGGTFAFTCTTPLPAEGMGNFDGEPQLASASHLSAASPHRASGNASFALGLDIDGELWASPPSIGADQYHAGSVTGPLVVAIRTPWTNVAVGFSLEMKALIDGRTVASRWNFADGTTVSNQPYATHRWLSPGQYAVTLTAFNESQTGGIMTTVLVQVVESTQYVTVNSPSPVPPYASWATAATNIQDAVDAASPGGEVVVTNGVYAFGGRVVHAGLTNRVAATKPLTIRSVNGPGVTIIRGNQDQGGTNGLGASAVRGVYLANGAALIGFTVTNAATLNDCCEFPHALGGGVYCESVAATVADCTILGNHALGGGGVHSGTVNNSSLVGNLAVYDGGGAFESVLSRCTLEFNEADQGGAAIFSTVSACLIATNSAAWGGGLYGSSIISESLVIGNQASIGGGGAATTDMTDDTVIRGNSAPTGGGVVQGRLDDCDLINNFASLNGGGAFAAELLNCRLTGNVADGDGGGAAGVDANNPVTLRYCYVTGNMAGGFGGGFSSGYAEGCLITDNHATNGVGGGGVTSTLINCTVVGNSAYLCGGVWGSSLTNCIVYHNSISQPESAFANFDSGTVAGPGGAVSSGSTPYFTCTTPLPAGGAGNITNEPALVDISGGNFRLQSNSPCINAGRNASVAGGTNLDGPYRISGGTVDMGAYEFFNPASTLSYAWLLQHGLPLDGSADTADSDGDLFENYHEWRAGTDPTNAMSLLRLLPPRLFGSNLAVSWQSIPGHSYSLEQSADLGATPRFTVVAAKLAAAVGTNLTTFTHTNLTNSGPSFYRVRVDE